VDMSLPGRLRWCLRGARRSFRGLATGVEHFPTPQLNLSRLRGNGLRAASKETYGHLSSIGLFVSTGSRVESLELRGATQLIELMGFKGTLARPHQQIYTDIASLGGAPVAFSARDLLLFNVEVLRESVEPAMEILAETVLQPKFEPQEVEEMKEVMMLQHQNLPPASLLKEALHAAAFGEASSLGKSHFCPAEDVGKLHSGVLREYMARYFNSENLVLVGAGVDHEDFIELAERYFADVPIGRPVDFVPPPYIGGETKHPMDELVEKSEFCHMGVAWMGSWDNIDDRVPLCVLHVLLGGGNSFSAGGPGKGMYSRLYRHVLNRFPGVETAESFIEPSGLVGLLGACGEHNATGLMSHLCHEFLCLSDPNAIDEVELSRARNMLKCNVLTTLESHHMVFEDIGQQLVADSSYVSPEEVCERIDATTAQDIARVVTAAAMKGPSVAYVGPHIGNVPDFGLLKRWCGH